MPTLWCIVCWDTESSVRESTKYWICVCSVRAWVLVWMPWGKQNAIYMTLNQKCCPSVFDWICLVSLLKMLMNKSRKYSVHFKCINITDICSSLKLAARRSLSGLALAVAKSKSHTLFILIFICLLLFFFCILNEGVGMVLGGILYCLKQHDLAYLSRWAINSSI